MQQGEETGNVGCSRKAKNQQREKLVSLRPISVSDGDYIIKK